MLSLTVSLGPQNILLLRMGIRRQSLGAVMAICILGDITLIPLGTVVMGYLTAISPWVRTTLQLGGAAFLLWFAWTCWRDSYTSKSFPGATPETPTSALENSTDGSSSEATVSADGSASGRGVSADGSAFETTVSSGGCAVAVGDSADGSVSELTVSAHGGSAHGSVAGRERTPGGSSSTAVATEPVRTMFRRPAWVTPAMAMAFVVTFVNPSCYLDCVVLVGSLANQFGAERWAFTLGAMCSSLIWFPAITYGAKLLAKPLSRPVVNKWLDRAIAVIMALIAVRVALM